jgi:HAD superfamily hydrolase (TIGR01509 family)
MTLNALLFDLDGTLADTDPTHYLTWQDMLRGYDLEIDPDFYKKHFSGRRNIEIFQELLPQLSLAEGEQLSQAKEAAFRDRASHLLPLPGLFNLLTWADEQDLRQAVVTNAPRENAEFMLQTLGLSDRFSTVVLGEELVRGKPDPLPYQVALEQLGVSAEQAVAFEDSPSGVRAAIAAGIPTVGIATTQTPELLYQLGVILVIADFTDARLQDILRSPQKVA